MLRIERATSEDVPALELIEKHWEYKRLPANAMSTTGALTLLLGAEKLSQFSKSKDATILVARSNVDTVQQVLGFVLTYRKELALEIYPKLQNSYAPENSIWAEPFCYLKTIAIEPKHTGQGIGKELLKKVASESKLNGSTVILTRIAVEPANLRSLALFTNTLGCSEVARHHVSESGITWGLFKSRIL